LTSDWIIVEKIPEQEHVTDAMSYHHPANPNRRKHADLIHAWAEGSEIQFFADKWIDIEIITSLADSVEYRIKPKTQTVRFRNWLSKADEIIACYGKHEYINNTSDNIQQLSQFKQWLGDWQEVEIEE